MYKKTKDLIDIFDINSLLLLWNNILSIDFLKTNQTTFLLFKLFKKRKVHETDFVVSFVNIFFLKLLFYYNKFKKQKKSYLVDPASNICLSQRLSHACLSINKFILWNCVQLIKSVIIYLMVSYSHGYP
jgi:hypothetical protein